MNKGISKVSHKISQMWKQQDLGAPALAKSQTGRHKFHLQGNSKDKDCLKGSWTGPRASEFLEDRFGSDSQIAANFSWCWSEGQGACL